MNSVLYEWRVCSPLFKHYSVAIWYSLYHGDQVVVLKRKILGETIVITQNGILHVCFTKRNSNRNYLGEESDR